MATDKVKVGNPKSFALTQGKEYDVIARSADSKKITIVNDNNITASYFGSVFQNAGNVEKKAAKPKAVVLPTVEEVMSTFHYDIGNGNVSFSVQGAEYEQSVVLGNASSNISCGIRQIFGLNTFIDSFTEFFENELNHIPATLRDELINAMLKASIMNIMENTTQVAMFVASTNTNYAEFGRIDAQLTPMTVSSFSRMNPNSGNEIKLWVLNQQFE
tara:strand:- start:8445 stop:9092 length:648 start_codon:yes stop_codon:yes gene_type:complete